MPDFLKSMSDFNKSDVGCRIFKVGCRMAPISFRSFILQKSNKKKFARKHVTDLDFLVVHEFPKKTQFARPCLTAYHSLRAKDMGIFPKAKPFQRALTL